LTPVLFLKQMGQFAKEFNINMDYLEYGFDPEMVFERARKPSAKKKSMLKEIESKFSKPASGEDQRAVQLIIDENAFNTYLLELVMIDSSLSVRDYMNLDSRTRMVAEQMNLENLAIIMPEIKDEFGEKGIFDVMFSMSHSLMKDKVEGQRITGFNLDKNGNFRVTLNFYI
jgi:hypothetical protein